MRRTTTIVLALAALVLAACGVADSSPHAADSTSTTGPSSAGPVPWAALPATHPHIPSTRVRPRPDPVLARAARGCRAGDLRMRALGIGAAMGTAVKNLRFSLAPGHAACAVSGRPGLEVRTVEGSTVLGSATRWSSYRQPVLLTHHATALVQLVWPSACYAPWGQGSASLTYAGRTWSMPMGQVSRNCHFEPDRPLLTVGVTAFLPPHLRPARRVTAYNQVTARGPHVLSAHLGRATTFDVTLVARRDLPLDPCPTTGSGPFPVMAGATP